MQANSIGKGEIDYQILTTNSTHQKHQSFSHDRE